MRSAPPTASSSRPFRMARCQVTEAALRCLPNTRSYRSCAPGNQCQLVRCRGVSASGSPACGICRSACPPKPNGSSPPAAASNSACTPGATRCQTYSPGVGAKAPNRSARASPTATASSTCARTCTNGAAIGTTPPITPSSPAENPQGPAHGVRRSSKGGAWRHQIKFSRCAARSSIPPEFRYADYGFRIVVGSV